jgi:hypothetical protein
MLLPKFDIGLVQKTHAVNRKVRAPSMRSQSLYLKATANSNIGMSPMSVSCGKSELTKA